MMRLKMVGMFGSFAVALLAACATEAPMTAPSFTKAERMPTMIELDRPVHFTAPDGAPVIVPAGSYDVRLSGSNTLALAPDGGGTPLAIAAAPSPHTYRASQLEPVAIALPGEEEDTHHILLAQVDGSAFDAVGTYSGLQTRGLSLYLSPMQGQLYIETKAYTSSPQTRVTGPVAAEPQAPTVSASISITTGPHVTNYQDCVGLTGYVGSIVTMRIASLTQQDRPIIARFEDTRPLIVRVGNPVQLPPQPVPSDVSYPNTPFMRVFPNNPYRCMFGSVTVSTRNLMAGSKVRLKMTVHDLTPRRTMLIADTYELPMTSSGIVTFGKVVISSVSVQGVDRNRTDDTTFVINALRTRAPNGALVKIEASVDGGPSAQRDCLYKPDKGGAGSGTLTCK